MEKVIGVTIEGKIMVFDSEEELRDHNDKLAAEVLNNAFTTDEYKE